MFVTNPEWKGERKELGRGGGKYIGRGEKRRTRERREEEKERETD